MFSHIMIGSNDIARSKKFYDALFAAIGAEPGTEDTAKGRLAYSHKGARFVVTKPIDGKPASTANGGTIGFAVGDVKSGGYCKCRTPRLVNHSRLRAGLSRLSRLPGSRLPG